MQVDVNLRVGDVRPLKEDFTARGFLEKVKTAQKRTLTRAGRSDNNDYISLVYFKVNAFENFEVIEFFSSPSTLMRTSLSVVTVAQPPFEQLKQPA